MTSFGRSLPVRRRWLTFVWSPPSRSIGLASRRPTLEFGHTITYLDTRLDLSTVDLAAGAHVVCGFVNDDLSAPVLEALAGGGTTCLAMRCAGFNNVGLEAAQVHGITVVRQRTDKAHRPPSTLERSFTRPRRLAPRVGRCLRSRWPRLRRRVARSARQ